MPPDLRSLAAALALALAACGGADRDPRPNVLLVSLDSVRRDLLGCYGGGSPHAPGVSPSPHLDRLAEQGVRMDRAFATTSWTLPSHLTLFSGAPELVHGVDSDRDRLALDLPLLAEVLAQAGYRTAGFYSGPYLEPTFGTGRGFDRYESRYGDQLTLAREAQRVPGAEVYDPRPPSPAVEYLSHRDRSSDRVTEAALEELERAAADEAPFFLFVHYFDPHYDYVPPAPYDERFDPAYAGPVDGADFLTDPALSVPDPTSPSGRRRTASQRDLEHVRALYAGELAWTDAMVGRLLDRLAALGLAEDTLVIVVSDHGDEFFENGGLGHRRTLHDEVLAVPLLLRLPGRLPAGATPDRVVSLADVAPTLLELVGEEAAARAMVGRSFAGAWTGDAAEPVPGAIGRLVTQAPTRFALGGQAYEGVQVTVQESFRTDALVVHRSRRWLEPRTGLPTGVQDEFRALQETTYAAERLTWNRLDERGEPSDDFSGPEARAALDAFRSEHARLVAARRAGGAVSEDVAFRAQLEALGYAGSSSVERTDWLVLPPPGRALPNAEDERE